MGIVCAWDLRLFLYSVAQHVYPTLKQHEILYSVRTEFWNILMRRSHTLTCPQWTRLPLSVCYLLYISIHLYHPLFRRWQRNQRKGRSISWSSGLRIKKASGSRRGNCQKAQVARVAELHPNSCFLAYYHVRRRSIVIRRLLHLFWSNVKEMVLYGWCWIRCQNEGDNPP